MVNKVLRQKGVLNSTLPHETWNIVLHAIRVGVETSRAQAGALFHSTCLDELGQWSKPGPASVGVLLRRGISIILKFKDYVSSKMRHVYSSRICEQWVSDIPLLMSIRDVLSYLLRHSLVSVSEGLVKDVGPEIQGIPLKLDFIVCVWQYEDFNESHQYLFVICVLPHFYRTSSLIMNCYIANCYELVILHFFFVAAPGAEF